MDNQIKIFRSQISSPATDSQSAKATTKTNNLISNLRALTRLIVGGLVIGSDKLSTGIRYWESTSEENSNSIPTSAISTIEIESKNQAEILPHQEEDDYDTFRYLLVGLIFKSQDQIEAGINTLDKTTRRLGKLTNQIVQPISRNPLIKPFRNQFNKLVLRGEEQVNQWIDIGRSEEIRSKNFAEIAAVDQVDIAFTYLAENQEVQEIIQGQSATLAGEIVEEIRERAISADYLLEGTIRIILRMKNRAELPEPPPEVIAKVKHSR